MKTLLEKTRQINELLQQKIPSIWHLICLMIKWRLF